MTVSTFGAPVTFICIPDERAHPGNLTRTLPALSPATATETSLELSVTPDSGNLTDANGIPAGRPVATGTPSSSTLSLTVDVLRSGAPDRTARYTYTSGTDTYGQTPPYVVSGFETVIGVASGNGYREPRGRALPNGNLLVVCERWVTSSAVFAATRSASTQVWTTVGAVWSSSTAFTSTIHAAPDLWLEPGDTASGAVAYMGSWEVTAANTITLRIDRSVDGGATWSFVGYSNLSLDVTSIVYDRTRFEYDPLSQMVVLVIHKLNGADHTLETYTSTDHGASWNYSTSANAITSGRVHDLWSYNGTFWLAYVENAGSVSKIAKRTAIDAAWTAVASNGAAQASQNYMAAVGTPWGQFWTFSRNNSLPERIEATVSDNAGVSWGSPSGTYPASDTLGEEVIDDSSSTSGLDFETAIYDNGRIWLIGTLLSGGTVDYSISAVVLGLRSNITTTAAADSVYTYYPSDLPVTKISSWTYTGGSGQSLVVDATGNLMHRIDTTNATGYVTDTTGGTSGSIRVWSMGPSSTGGSTASSAIAMRSASQDGAGNYSQVEIRIDATGRQARLFDVVAAANRGNAVSLPATGKVHFKLIVNGANQLTSAYYRGQAQSVWSAIATNQTATSTAGVTTGHSVGKLAASTAQVDSDLFASLGPSNGLDDGAAVSDLTGIPAATLPDRIPASILLHWQGSPLQSGDSWTVAARSTKPLEFTSALSVCPSPSRPWVGASGAAARSEDWVYDFGTAYKGRLSTNLVFSGIAKAPGIASFRLGYWTGAGFNAIATGSTLATNFTAGSTKIERQSSSSYRFTFFGTTNADLQLWRPDGFRGYWCEMSDGGGNTIAGTVLHNDPGQATATTGVLSCSFEFDPSTVVDVAGGFAGFSNGSSTCSLALYAPDCIVIGVQATDSTRYYQCRVTLASGATVPQCGLFLFGAAYPLARPYRDGASWRLLTDPKLPRGRRIIELPYDQILVPNGTYNITGAAAQNTLSWDGSTPRATADNNVGVLVSALEMAGRKDGQRSGLPVGLVIDGKCTADPGSAAQSFVGQDVAFGYLEDSLDVTAGRGFLRSKDSTDGTELGTSIVLNEAALYMNIARGAR